MVKIRQVNNAKVKAEQEKTGDESKCLTKSTSTNQRCLDLVAQLKPYACIQYVTCSNTPPLLLQLMRCLRLIVKIEGMCTICYTIHVF